MQTAAVALVLDLCDLVNSIPEVLSHYDTQWGLRTFALTALSAGLMRLIGIGLAAGLAAGIGMACYPDLLMNLQKCRDRDWIRDSLASVAASLGTLMLIQCVASQIEYRARSVALAPPLSVPQNLGTYLPAISSARDALLAGLFMITMVGLFFHLWTCAAKSLWQRGFLLTGLIASLLPAAARRSSEVVFDLLPSLLLVALVCVLAKLFLRRNYLAYVFSTAAICFYRTVVPLLGQGNPALSAQGGALLALVAILGFAYLRGFRRSFAPSS
jgi:hypothetical protein